MGINYVENDNGHRRVRWMGLATFFLVCMSVPAIAYLGLRLIAPGALHAQHLAVGLGLISGLAIFGSALTRTFRMPVDRLPSPKGS